MKSPNQTHNQIVISGHNRSTIHERDERPDLRSYFEECNKKIIKKATKVSKDVHEVTIGPYSTCLIDSDKMSPISGLNEFKEVVTSTPNRSKRSQKSGKSAERNMAVLPKRKLDPQISVAKMLIEIENQRRHEVQEAVKHRSESIALMGQKNAEEAAARLATLHANSQAREIAAQEELLREIKEDELRSAQSKQQVELKQQQHAQRVSQRNEMIRAAEQRKKEEEAERKRAFAQRLKHMEEMQQCQIECSQSFQRINDLLKSNPQALKPIATPHNSSLKIIGDTMQRLVQQCKVGDVTSDDVQSAKVILGKLQSIKNLIQEEADKIQKQIQEEEKQKLMQQQQFQDQQQQHQQQQLQQQQTSGSEPQAVPAAGVTYTEKNKGITGVLSDCLDKPSLQTYLVLKEYQSNVEKSYEALTKDPRLKTFRFDCQKAVTIPVNAISPVSKSHLEDKLQKLSRLLSGQPVTIGEKIRVSASEHPAGVTFCKDWMAKKFVQQGESTVSSKPEAAFAIAAVIAALWQDYPDWGQLVLAHFHKKCPYLVPMFLPQVEGQSNQDYYRSLGYQYDEEGNVEKQDKFLKRMSGIMRLYSAVLISRLPRDRQNRPHPHGLAQGWRWLTSLLNLEPRPDICATLIYDFLEVAGSSMFQQYGRQFQKLLLFLCKEYFPRLKKVEVSSSGPVVRLETFLQDILKQGHIKPPSKQLPPNFW